MAKVYEALRRAEEERRRRAGETAGTVAPLLGDRRAQQLPAVPAFEREAQRPRRRFLRLFRRRNRRASKLAIDEANKRRIALLQPESFVAEQFRTLRGRIDAIAARQPIRSLVVTSPVAGDGKTTAAINLASVTALSLGRRVLLIDCDLRRPKVHLALGLQPETGLAEVLRGDSSLEAAVLKVEGMNLEVLAVRGRPSNPSELLSSEAMSKLVEEAATRYDRVILDTPAALGMPDTKAVADLADGVVMVARADVTAHQDLEAAVDLLGRRRVLGVVLNGTQGQHGRYGYVG